MKIKNIMLVILTVLIFVIFTACSSDEDKKMSTLIRQKRK